MSEGSQGTMRRWLWIPLVGLVAAGGVVALRSSRTKEPPPSPPAPVTAAPVATTSHAPLMPSEEVADAQVRKYAADISSSATYASWLQVGDLARRFVSAVNTVADGDSPRTVLSFLAPHGRFQVTARHGQITVNARSYKRYDGVADVIASFDVKVAARAYSALHPLLTSAYAEIGKPGTTLDGRLAQALQELEETKTPAGPVQLVEAGVNYKFADESLESLSPAQKHLLRMGPRNMKLIQDKLHELSDALHLGPVAAAGRRGAGHPG